MQEWPLTVDRILDHAQMWQGRREVVSRSIAGPIVRTTYSDIYRCATQLPNALLSLGIQQGDRVATLTWNTARHMEAWYGILGIGAVCHTLNPRLFAEQLTYIINHASDRIILADQTFIPKLESILPDCSTSEHVIVLTDDSHKVPLKWNSSGSRKSTAHTYVSLIATHTDDAKWGVR